MSPKTRVTQNAIAAELGVSQFTVSEALRGTSNVSPETRELVLKTARELGYRLNSSARAIVTGRFNAAALLRTIDEKDVWFPVDLVNGAEQVLENRNMRLLTARVAGEQLEDESYVPQILQEWAIDGVLVHCLREVPERLPALLTRYRIPAIWLNTKREFDCIYIDDLLAGREATERLLDFGHRRIAFLPGFFASHYSSADRAEGYATSMRNAGLKPLIISREGEPERRDPFVRQRVRETIRRENITAIVGYSHFESQTATYAALEEGLKPGVDISIVSCASDTFTISEDMFSISCMHLDWREMGRRAADMLLEKIQNPTRKLPPVRLEMSWYGGLTIGQATSRKRP